MLKTRLMASFPEIRRTIALGKQAFMNKKKLFTGNLSIELKCGPMPIMMAAQSNTGGALSESSVIPFLV